MLVLCFFLLVSFLGVESGECNDTGRGEDTLINNESKESLKEVCIKDLRISVIYDNRAYRERFEPAWGFSCLVTGTAETILFDTGGDGELLLRNMNRLGIDPDTVDWVLLSHAHWDHIGGMESFLEKNRRAAVYVLKSFPSDFKKGLREAGIELVEVDEPVEVCRGVYSTGELGRSIKEQSLVIHTDMGLVVITGCAHPGVVEIIKKAKSFIDDDILFVMGGFHLGGVSRGELEKIVASFRDLNVKHVAPCHCSGDAAIGMFRDRYKEDFVDVGAGKVITADDLE